MVYSKILKYCSQHSWDVLPVVELTFDGWFPKSGRPWWRYIQIHLRILGANYCPFVVDLRLRWVAGPAKNFLEILLQVNINSLGGREIRREYQAEKKCLWVLWRLSEPWGPLSGFTDLCTWQWPISGQNLRIFPDRVHLKNRTEFLWLGSLRSFRLML